MGSAWTFPAWLYIPLAALSLGALVLLLWALLGDRARGRRRCPRCWYDMQGSPSLTCPECGRVARSAADLGRTRVRWVWAALSLLPIIVLLALFLVRDGRRAWYMLPPKWVTVERIDAGTVRATRERLRNPDERGERVVLSQGGRSILSVEDSMVEIGQQRYGSPDRFGAGEDLNGDGVADLVVFAYSGGAHCCYVVHVVECTSPARVVATIDARNGMGLVRFAGAGETLFNISDQSFDYWNAPHAASPFPSVFYRLRNHHLEIALDRMIRLPTDAPNLAGASGQLDSMMWGHMLDLLYSGNEEACWAYFDGAWPAGLKGKDEFKAEFVKTLEGSPQWRDFQRARAAAAKGEAPDEALVGKYVPETP